MIKWVIGPLGYPASEKDWNYWCPTLKNKKYRAIYYPRFDTEMLILGDNLDTLEEAKNLCEIHKRQNPQ